MGVPPAIYGFMPRRLPTLLGFKRFALGFDGVDDYVEVVESIDLNPHTSDWTIEVVAKPLGLTPKVFGNPSYAGFAPISKRQRSGVGNYELLLLLWSDTGSEPARWCFLYHGDNQAAGVCSPKQYYLGRWYHVVGVRIGGELYVYVNGERFGPNNWKLIGVFPTATTDISSSDPWRVCRKADWGVYFKGVVAYVRMYRRALSQGEVLYNMLNYGYPSRNELVLWLYDKIVDKWYDDSGYGNDGDIYGATREELRMWELRAGIGL